MKKFLRSLLLLLWLLQPSLFAANPIDTGAEIGPTPQLTRDIFPGFDRPNSDPQLFTANDSAVYFTAKTYAEGRELWMSTAAGNDAVMVKDLTPGRQSSNILRMFGMGQLMFFVMDDGVHGRELWRSDGTEAGTFMLADIYPGEAHALLDRAVQGDMVAFGGQLYFAANDGVRGIELWRTNGTVAGTVLFKDLKPLPDPIFGSIDSFPYQLTVFAGALYFSAGSSSQGEELWRSDGTPAGTVILKDINPGAGFSSPFGLTVVGPTLYFVAYEPTHGVELWKSNGTSSGTLLVKDLKPGPAYYFNTPRVFLTKVGSWVVFGFDDPAYGLELWRSDGTDAGTQLVKDINPGSAGSGLQLDIASNGNEAWFTANDGVTGTELWSTDGTEGGTYLVQNITLGAGESYQIALTAVGSSVYFYGDDQSGSRGLWKAGRNQNSASLLKNGLSIEVAQLPSTGAYAPFATLGNTVYFGAMDRDGVSVEDNEPTLYGNEPWKSEGTAATTVPLKDIIPTNGSDAPRNLTKAGNGVYFTAYSAAAGVELWKSDGTLPGTVLVKDIRPGPGSSTPRGLTVSENLLFFLANDGFHGTELWRSDGTEGGTYLVKEIVAGPLGLTDFSTGYYDPALKAGAAGKIYFTADDGFHGPELWASDGSSFGTAMVSDIKPGTSGSRPYPLGWVDTGGSFSNGVYYFIADDGVHGYELWKTDGNAAGTELVKDINPGTADSYPSNFAVQNAGSFNHRIFFRANDGTHGAEPWRSDGSAFGTQLIADILPGAESSNPQSPIFDAVSNKVLFIADDGVHGNELWSSDGFDAALVRDITIGAQGSSLDDFTVFNGVIYFVKSQRELWKFNGATAEPAGITIPVLFGYKLFATPTKLIFWSQFDDILWESNGTPIGTIAFANMDGDHASFEMNEMEVTQDRVFIIGRIGREETKVWSLPILPIWDGWRKQHFGTTFPNGDAADHADPDGDGTNNLLERAFGLNPNRPDTHRLPVPVWISDTNFVGYQMQYTIEPGVPSLSYIMEASSTMQPGSWLSLGNPSSQSNLDVFYRLDTLTPKNFMRWKVTADP